MHDTQDISIETLGALQASVLDAVVAIDEEGKVVAWNDLSTEIFGWTEQEATGRLLGDLIVPMQHREAHHLGMLRYLSTGIATVVRKRIEITAVNRSGREFPVELSIMPAAKGSPAAFVGFIRDISERRDALDRLAVSEESLRLATEAAEVGTWDLDILTDTLTWSDRTKRMFGISAGAECSMVDFYTGLHPDDREATSAAFAAALDPGVRGTYNVEYRTIGKEDGRIRYVAAKGKGLFDAAGRCVRAVGTAIDITVSKSESARQRVLHELTELLRSSDTVAALNAACAAMGQHFDVSRVGYGQLDADEDIFNYTVCWTNGRVPALLGKYPARAFGEQIVARLSAGHTVVVNDLFGDAISNEATTLETGAKVDTRSILVVPFLRGGRLRTIVYLNAQQPRDWCPDEITFMQTVAERTRQLIDKAESEAAITARDEEFRAFAQAMPNHAWMADVDGQLYWFNAQVYAYSGAEVGSLDGENWGQLVHPDDLAVAAAAWGQALIAGVIYETQFRIRRNDGEYRWHLIRAVPVIDPNGQVSRWIGTNTDIHDQKIAEEALSESRSRLRAVLDSAGEAFYATDTDGNTTLCNRAFLELLGFEKEEDAIGRKLHDVVHHTHPDGSHYPKSECPIYRCAQTGQFAHVDDELFFRLDGTSFPVEYRASAIMLDGVVQGAICTFTDITERRRNETLLRDMNETLETRVRETIADRDRTWQNSRDLLVIVSPEGTVFDL